MHDNNNITWRYTSVYIIIIYAVWVHANGAGDGRTDKVRRVGYNNNNNNIIRCCCTHYADEVRCGVCGL